jgi:hypothetical protein
MRTKAPAFIHQRATGCILLGALVFSMRAWLIRAGGSPLPFWDQWDGEALGLYLPWLQGKLGPADLLAAHNEHRIVLTRLADLVLYFLNGGWNCWQQMLLNAALHAMAAAALAAGFWHSLGERSRVALLAGIAVLFVVPCGWQNALWGFQSQVYFASLLALAAIFGLLADSRRGMRSLGGAAAVLGLFANGSGVLAPIAVLVALVVASFCAPSGRREWASAAGIAAIAGIGLLLRVDPEYHARLHAATFAQFGLTFARCLSWPHVDSGGWWLLLQAPVAVLVFQRWRRRTALDSAERCALALAVFGVLHAAAVAYSRGAGLPEHRPLSRYQDPLLLGAAAQLWASLRLAREGKRSWRLGALMWAAACAVGLIGLTEKNLAVNLTYKRAQDRAGLAAARAYMETGNATAFLSDPGATALHPDPTVVRRVLDEPALRAGLPRVLRETRMDVFSDRPWIVAYAPGLSAVAAVLLGALLASMFLRAFPADVDRCRNH